jgi:hypothetical protein
MMVVLLNGIKMDISKLLVSTMTDVQSWPETVLCEIKCIINAEQQSFGHGTNLKAVSKKFKTLTGYTYTETVNILGMNKCIIKAPLESIPDECSGYVEVDTMRYYEWESLKIVQIHKDNIRRLAERFGVKTDRFNWTVFNDLTMLRNIKDLDVAISTKLNYVTAICVVLDYTAGILYTEYVMLRMELALNIARENLQRKVPCFTELIKPIRKCFYDKTANESVRILCLVIMNNVTGDGINLMVKNLATETGVLRPSDLINTTFNDVGENYIALLDKQWEIRACSTKNKQKRTLLLDSDFIDGVYFIYGDKLPEYLVVAKGCEKYTGSMSDIITQHLGYNFDIIRSSYFTWRNRTAQNREELIELCRRQGHKYSTAMMNYNRIVDHSIISRWEITMIVLKCDLSTSKIVGKHRPNRSTSIQSRLSSIIKTPGLNDVSISRIALLRAIFNNTDSKPDKRLYSKSVESARLRIVMLMFCF